MLKRLVKGSFEKLGLSICKSNGNFEANSDVGRDYEDPITCCPRFILKKGPLLPWSCTSAEFIVDNGKSTLKEIVYYSHLTLLKMCKHFNFETVLDIGSHEKHCTRIFEHLGKKVTTIEISPGYEADYKCDYLDQKFNSPFDAIWCSQTYEHQRNPGIFLDKIFDNLKDNGVLALTVPFQIDRTVCFGHINSSSPLMLLYQLVCAGFDCKNISLKTYNSFIGILLTKKYNGIKRKLPFGSLPLKGQKESVKQIVGDEIFDKMDRYFPFDVTYPNIDKKISSINWNEPI